MLESRRAKVVFAADVVRSMDFAAGRWREFLTRVSLTIVGQSAPRASACERLNTRRER